MMVFWRFGDGVDVVVIDGGDEVRRGGEERKESSDGRSLMELGLMLPWHGRMRGAPIGWRDLIVPIPQGVTILLRLYARGQTGFEVLRVDSLANWRVQVDSLCKVQGTRVDLPTCDLQH
jgi:hypothetical protein